MSLDVRQARGDGGAVQLKRGPVYRVPRRKGPALVYGCHQIGKMKQTGENLKNP